MVVHKKLCERNVPTVKPQLGDTFKAVCDNHINTVSVIFNLYPYQLYLLPLRTRTHPHNISINYLIDQMTQSIPHTSSNSSDVSTAIQTHAASLPFRPVTPSPSVGPGVAHDSVPTQDGYYPSEVADVPRATHVGSYPPIAAATPPPQHQSAPLSYDQPFLSSSFPGSTTHYAPQPPSSLLPETILAEAAEDPNVWSLINESEGFLDPELLLYEYLADAAEDPDLCNSPIRTLLICSWLNISYGSALYLRSRPELAPFSSAFINNEM
ncbi:uncharacterized protein HD556DRAFT_1447415 [Suillus plorans]|uniref:Uncharacterized protein n=1 Tax=Suillus plorans TaxID=116603 RepID=A0A9P7AIB1_9AGAM|nr:uncharacterized protein HD556DRAFT_1447415 [Suillus plorans]KAG1788942.1 hypothetical protein HD556DRAFT_1447415 [Suillus plorans]